MPKGALTGSLRKVWPILIIVERSDDSDTMIRTYDMFKNIVQVVTDLQVTCPDFDIRIGAYSFSDISHFNHPSELVTLSEYDLLDFFKNDVADLAPVLNQLDKDLSKSALLNGMYGYYRPFLIFLFNGEKKYLTNEAIEQLKQNKWFQHSMKMAFIFNKNVQNEDILLELIGNKEAIITSDVENFNGLFKSLMDSVCHPCSGSIINSHQNDGNDALVFVDPIDDELNDDSWTGDDIW